MAQAKFGASVNLTVNATTSNVDTTKAITINYIDSSTGQKVGTWYYAPNGVVNGQLVDMTTADRVSNIKTNAPAGYVVNDITSGSALFTSLNNAKYGQAFNIPVTRNATLTNSQLQTIFSKIQVNPLVAGDTAAYHDLYQYVTDNNQLNKAFYNKAETAFITNGNLAIANNGTITNANFKSALTAAGLNDFYISTPKAGEDNSTATTGVHAVLKSANHSQTDTADSDITLSIDNGGKAINLHYTVTPVYATNTDANGNATGTINHGNYGQDQWRIK
ncbi:hypothetical protein [Lentilactobacillus farraginis]|uniref:hypothetical protein n=1 Tax=Lentilactobacillus farraginis TaxID=390841 RepID=UPI00054D3336|nr:hypothetical protein [Lentilactobacillus farraginis]